MVAVQMDETRPLPDVGDTLEKNAGKFQIVQIVAHILSPCSDLGRVLRKPMVEAASIS